MKLKSSPFIALALGLGACTMPVLPEPSVSGPSSPSATDVPMSYQPVMAGTVNYAPAELKPWRELNDSVAPGAGRSP